MNRYEVNGRLAEVDKIVRRVGTRITSAEHLVNPDAVLHTIWQIYQELEQAKAVLSEVPFRRDDDAERRDEEEQAHQYAMSTIERTS